MTKGLTKATSEWRDEMLELWAFESHELKLLHLACECWDRATEAQAMLDKEGLIYIDRFGSPHPRPEIKIVENAVSQFAAIIKQLSLVDEVAKRPPGRPPATRALRF